MLFLGKFTVIKFQALIYVTFELAIGLNLGSVYKSKIGGSCLSKMRNVTSIKFSLFKKVEFFDWRILIYDKISLKVECQWYVDNSWINFSLQMSCIEGLVLLSGYALKKGASEISVYANKIYKKLQTISVYNLHRINSQQKIKWAESGYLAKNIYVCLEMFIVNMALMSQARKLK